MPDDSKTVGNDSKFECITEMPYLCGLWRFTNAYFAKYMRGEGAHSCEDRSPLAYPTWPRKVSTCVPKKSSIHKSFTWHENMIPLYRIDLLLTIHKVCRIYRIHIIKIKMCRNQHLTMSFFCKGKSFDTVKAADNISTISIIITSVDWQHQNIRIHTPVSQSIIHAAVSGMIQSDFSK